MIAQRFLFPVFIVVAGFAAAPVARADSAQDARNFITDFGNRAVAALTSKDLSDQELVQRFRVLFEEGFDIPFIARSALGRFWPRATDQEKAQYVPLFEDYIVEIYAGQFRDYKGQTFHASSAQTGADGVITVTSDVVLPDGGATKLEWIVVMVDGKPKIRDIKIEGVSMIITYRDQFANEILQHDGKVAGLIDALREKAASLHANSNG
jgi:phospholipid transport system substrate-binding protein